VRPFRDRPIRQKVLILIVGASVVGLIFAGAFVSIYDLVSFRRRAVTDAQALAGVVSPNAISAIAFNDTAAAQADLRALADRREIGSAAIYLPDGREFARYTRPGGPDPIATPPEGEATTLLADRLISVTRLATDGVDHGWLRIQYMLPGFASRLPQYAMVAAAVLTALAAAAALLLGTLSRSVSGPLHQLAATARTLAATNDLRIRAARHADDEIGSLTGAFNRMLDTLEERDAALADRARALRESEERLRLALGAATMRTWALPLVGTPARVTAEPAAMAEFLGTVHPEDRAGVEAAIDHAVTARGALETEFRTPPGAAPERRIALRGHVSAEVDGAGTQLIGVAQDVTGRRQLEAQLMQAQKMEAIGNLAGGIAHDFNNLLTGMIGHLKFVQRALPPGTQVRADVDEVERAARRAAALTSQLLSYARRQMVTPTVIDVNAAVLAIEPMLQRSLGETVALEVQLGEGLAPVRVDAGQLEQVLVNLAVNARDAMPEGGRLIISTGARTISDGPADAPAAGTYTEIAVTDTGQGIPPDLLPHIFEPFFTTKPVGQGTGLGLAMCYGIIKQAEGHILVESVVGRGTTIRIRLPALRETGSVPERPAPPPADAVGGHETILLAEDNPAIRELAARTLREAGYRVIEVEDGARARDAAERSTEVDLLITDVVMPGQTGRELAAALRKARPSLPVVFMSGYSDVAGDGHDPADPFLAKPFAPDDLRRAARQALDARRGAPA
jgi:signal transduction histidine kinase/CheY-like chemotaxis protein/HAMP domain-containing protein